MIHACSPGRLACGWVAALAVALTAAAEPVVSLRVTGFPDATFANFAAIVLPEGGYESLDLRLESALAPIQTSTVRVTLNNMPMTPFVAVNPTPSGVRIIVRLNASLSPDYQIKRAGESILTFDARDVNGTAYRGQFYLTIDPARSQPEPARLTKPRTQQETTIAPPQFRAPAIQITSNGPERTADRIFWLEAEVTDEEGLRKLVIELNGRDVEEVVLQNERPTRYRDGRLARGGMAGEVSGDGQRVQVRIPITLAKERINVVAVRAENVKGLAARADRTVAVFK